MKKLILTLVIVLAGLVFWRLIASKVDSSPAPKQSDTAASNRPKPSLPGGSEVPSETGLSAHTATPQETARGTTPEEIFREVAEKNRGKIVELQYADFCRDAGLDPERSEALNKLLAEKAAIVAETVLTVRTEAPDLANDRKSLARIINDASAPADESIRQLLGDHDYTRLEHYTTSLPARNTVKGIAGTAAQKGIGLSDVQINEMIRIIHDTAPAMQEAPLTNLMRSSDITPAALPLLRPLLTEAQYAVLIQFRDIYNDPEPLPRN